MRRVVVTGMGMLTPLGCGVETTWQRLLKGESGAKKIDRFDVSDIACQIACSIPRGDLRHAQIQRPGSRLVEDSINRHKCPSAGQSLRRKYAAGGQAAMQSEGNKHRMAHQVPMGQSPFVVHHLDCRATSAREFSQEWCGPPERRLQPILAAPLQ